MEENKTHELKFLLKDLNCANCSVKIENRVKELKEVSEASIDFVTKTLRVRVSDQDTGRITESINGIVKYYEPDVEVVRLDKEQGYKIAELADKQELIKLVISTACFAAGAALSLPFYVKYALLLISYLLSGLDVIIKSVKNIKNGRVFDENFLMTVATLGAVAIGQYPEAAAVMLFYSVGEFFQNLSVNRSRKSILALMDIKSDYANLKVGNKIEKVSPDTVIPGDIILVKPGERVPLDGIITKGQSAVDTSPLTGEPVPRDVRVDSQVLSGFINMSGVLMVKVTKPFGESTVSRILNLVENASSKKSVTENFITKFARIYTPVVVVFALILAFLFPAILNESYSKWIYRALIFLVVSCPCALVLSVPLSFFSGIGLASKNGILIKGTNYLEALSQTDCVVFDKTGTLTKGVFRVKEVIPSDMAAREELMEYSAMAEIYSNHPIALSIVKAYNGEIHRDRVKNYTEIPGLGIKAEVYGKEVLVGNSKLLDKFEVAYNVPMESGTTVYTAIDGAFAGNIVISDEIKEDSAEAVAELKKMGIKTAMLTGDVEKSAAEAVKELSMDEYYSQLLPDEKVYKFEEIQQKNKRTVFVGDGINDAPVLARADAGIAMGALGSDAAVEAADVVIMTDEPMKVVKTIKIAKRTKSVVWQNIIFILCVKAVVLILGALGYAAIWQAVFADVGVAVITVLNSLRVFKI